MGNVETPTAVRYSTRAAALAAIAWVTTTFLRKCPQDPAGVWAVTNVGTSVVLSEAGVAEQPEVEILAAFDPREISAVQVLEVVDPPEVAPEGQ